MSTRSEMFLIYTWQRSENIGGLSSKVDSILITPWNYLNGCTSQSDSVSTGDTRFNPWCVLIQDDPTSSHGDTLCITDALGQFTSLDDEHYYWRTTIWCGIKIRCFVTSIAQLSFSLCDIVYLVSTCTDHSCNFDITCLYSDSEFVCFTVAPGIRIIPAMNRSRLSDRPLEPLNQVEIHSWKHLLSSSLNY
jgi:hypothetical protein